MKKISRFTKAYRAALQRPSDGVVGLVNDLLRLCPKEGLQFGWAVDRCRVRNLAGGHEEVIEMPLRKSVFRAMLARLATLCNETNPESVSPYGGKGLLSVGAKPASRFRVSFVNTPDDHWFVLEPVRSQARSKKRIPPRLALSKDSERSPRLAAKRSES